MDQRARIVAATGVLLGGLLLALCFRHPTGRVETPIPGSSDRLVLRKGAAPGPVSSATEAGYGEAAGQTGSSPPSPQDPRDASPAVLKPMESGTPPPDLAKSYPAAGRPETSRWGVSMGLMLPETARPSTQTHRIVDGDTLAALAQRYLGSADRAMEIFDANAGLLSDPQLLPIGVELKLPPREPAAPQSLGALPDRPLVRVGQ